MIETRNFGEKRGKIFPIGQRTWKTCRAPAVSIPGIASPEVSNQVLKHLNLPLNRHCERPGRKRVRRRSVTDGNLITTEILAKRICRVVPMSPVSFLNFPKASPNGSSPTAPHSGSVVKIDATQSRTFDYYLCHDV